MKYKFVSGPFTFDADGLNRRTVHRISKIIGEDVLTLDFIIVNPVFQAVWDEREIFDWKGQKIGIVSKEGLYTMKKMAGRDQDLLDIKKLGLDKFDEE